jgi:putative ABC transport system permease protein
MRYLPLIWSNVWRRRIRTTFTLLSIFIAFLLFGIVMAVRAAFSLGIEVAGNDRLVLINKVTLIMPLPISYKQKIEGTPGVEAVTHQNWFNGAYQDQTNVLTTMAVDPPSFLSIYKEIKLDPEQTKKWLSDRQGIIVGRDIAERYKWKLGDRIPLMSSIYQGKDPWEFNISGIYDAETGFDKTQLFLRYDYLEENWNSDQKGIIGWYVVKISDPSRAVELGQTFDSMFANSGTETKTTTEKGFIEGFAKQIGDIGSITVAIASTVLFMFGLVAASTMVQSVRERTSELAVLKTLGFSDVKILVIVLLESLFITVVGGGFGLAAAWLFVQNGDPTGGLLPVWSLPRADVLAGIGLMVLMGLIAGVVPAFGAMRLQITDALRRT